MIRLEGVSKIYRRSHLGRVRETTGVAGLSLEIRPGEVFGLLGLNGSGKTTTIKLILGLHYASAGTVEVLGRIMPDLETLKRVGYLPEGAYISRFLTGREAVEFFIGLSGTTGARRRASAERVLQQVGMASAADRRIAEYSKGMLQRISLAQALVHDPELLVFDEPVTGLDPLAIREVRELVGWLKSRGKTIFFSSHDISEVERVCDRIGILSEGRLVKLVEQTEWRDRPGRLEEIFTQAVARSEGVGPLRFQP